MCHNRRCDSARAIFMTFVNACLGQGWILPCCRLRGKVHPAIHSQKAGSVYMATRELAKHFFQLSIPSRGVVEFGEKKVLARSESSFHPNGLCSADEFSTKGCSRAQMLQRLNSRVVRLEGFPRNSDRLKIKRSLWQFRSRVPNSVLWAASAIKRLSLQSIS